MKLKTIEFLFLDGQTTGMRPPAAQLLELAWTRAPWDQLNSPLESHLVQLYGDHQIPKRVSELTGIEQANLVEAADLRDVFQKLQLDLPESRVAVIHYAQFEKPFLLDGFSRLIGLSEIPFQILCSQQICKRLVPGLPSANIRGAAGNFGGGSSEVQRAGAHVRATQVIWRGLIDELAKAGIEDLASLHEWFSSGPVAKTKVPRYEYRLDKLKRLELPDAPGIYRMMAKSGEVLYVGKATSLKSRVNSYFRGQKGRDRFKLEMLAQVWDLQVTRCPSALEAALLETDEIKRLNPRYNLLLKRGQRQIVFYNREFSAACPEQSAEFSSGPFRSSNAIEPLRLLVQSLQEGKFQPVFYEPMDDALMSAGFALFCQMVGVRPEQVGRVRSLLALGLVRARQLEEPEDSDEHPEEGDEETEYSAEDIAGKFDRLVMRAAEEYRRAQKLTRLLDAQVEYVTEEGPRHLKFQRGSLNETQLLTNNEFPWQGLSVDDFDRMSILLSELAKYEHEIR